MRTTAPRRTVRRHRPRILLYHGGRILPNSTTHEIFWNPFGTTSYPAGYVAAVSQYFTDIAHDSGSTTNVYSVARQYFDKNPNGTIKDHVNYAVTDGGAVSDTTAPNDTECTSSIRAHCVTDAEIHGEITHLFGVPGTSNDIYFVFLPQDVDTCDAYLGCMASDAAFCAYHSAFAANGGTYIYANEPYADDPLAGGYGCDTGSTVVGSNADATINTASHEHNEAITDPTFRGWFTRNGKENGDKCAYNFGLELGGTVGVDAYNQIINGRNYYLQQEWSNSGRRCKQHA